MNSEEVQAAIKAAMNTDCVLCDSQDNVHFSVTVVSREFEGLSRIKQHRQVMAIFQEELADERLHALSLKTYTPEKWAQLLANTASSD